MKNFLLLGASHGLRPLFALITNVLVARLLGVEDYGNFIIIWSLSLVVAAVADFGTRNTALVDLSDKSFAEALPFFKRRYQWACAVFAISGLVLWVSTGNSLLLCFLAAALGVFEAYSDPWLLFCRARRQAGIEFSATLIQFAVTFAGLGILYFGRNINVSLPAVIGLMVAGNLARSFSAAAFLLRGNRETSPTRKPSASKAYRPPFDPAGTAGVVLMLLFARAPLLNGKAGLDLSEIGILGVLISLSQLQYVLAGLILSSVIPLERKSPENTMRHFGRYAVLSLVLAGLLFLGLPWILSLFGEGFGVDPTAGRLLMFLSVFTCFGYVFVNRLFSYRRFLPSVSLLGILSLCRWFGMGFTNTLFQTVCLIGITEILLVAFTAPPNFNRSHVLVS